LPGAGKRTVLVAFGSAGSSRSGRSASRSLFGPGQVGRRSFGAGTGLSGRSPTSRGLLGGRAGSRSTGSTPGPRVRRSTGGLTGGLFGGPAGRSARRARSRSRGRTTAIPTTTTPGRLRRALRAGWQHPRTQRARVRARKGWHKSRVRIRSRSRRLGDYLRNRKWALRMRGWGRGLADWWSRLWDALRTRASDPRYGRLHGWQLTAAAAAIGALGAGTKKTE